jgi:hypothetical protein
MDDELAHLRRAHESDPADEEAARRYEGALRRAGEHQDLDELYRLTFACPLAWDALPGSQRDRVRSCDTCQRDVYYVETRKELARWVSEGECVAIDPTIARESFHILVDAEDTRLGHVEGRPCVVEVAPGTGPSDAPMVRGRIAPPRKAPRASRETRSKAKQLLRSLDPRRK